ncbi:hypothetical protein [Dickeya oryzae]|uniref:hypothetical protein n=1 Tax=Dickeya oryzae TaxID=1240404 RepID=UPI001AECE476|nr:hypothetical protein [Dickeya oryzae]
MIYYKLNQERIYSLSLDISRCPLGIVACADVPPACSPPGIPGVTVPFAAPRVNIIDPIDTRR